MDPLLRSALRRGVLGFGLGLLADIGIMGLMRPGAFSGDAAALILHLLAGAVFGAVAMGCTVAYDVERWSVTRATLAHLCVTLGGMALLGLAPTPEGFVLPALACVAAYILIWLALYLSMRRKIRRMNRGVTAFKTMDGRRSPSE